MLTPFSKGNNRFMVFCDFCKKKFHGSIKISKNNRAYSMRVNGANFHHLDGNPENDVVENNEVVENVRNTNFRAIVCIVYDLLYFC